MTIHLENKCKT